MKDLEFPVIGTKTKGPIKEFDLNSPSGRRKYFKAKAGDEIAIIKKYLRDKTFIAYWIGKKNSGKGTYSRLFTEVFGEDKVELVSVGDLIREADNWKVFTKTKKYKLLKKYYRGYISFEDAVDAHLGRSTAKLLPTEFIMALLKAHLEGLEGKTVFIDGLPRETDQVSYSLFFRDLIAYRDDPDLFVLIDLPESVIEERIKYRVVCPKCKTSRNKKLLISSKVEHQDGEFFLLCDNPDCKGARMEAKEGDDKGIAPIKHRLDKDEEIIKTVFSLYGVPKVLMRNNVPKQDGLKLFDKYEITPEYGFKLVGSKVKVIEKPWTITDDNGIESYSLLAAPVFVSMIKQLADILSNL